MHGANQGKYELTAGEHIIVKSVLPEEKLNKLRQLANKMNKISSRPLYIANEETFGEDIVERYISAGINIILQNASPWIKSIIGNRWLVLTNKVLLRRTWPISEKEARNLGHNASNLTWHQDSNLKHGDKPMIVMMVPLQDETGITRPGLSILESPTKKFEGVFGYEGGRVSQFEEMITKKYGELKIAKPTMNSGDLLIFNGLTFHRTFSNDTMKEHRDALLVRVVKPEDAANFPKGPHWIIKTH